MLGMLEDKQAARLRLSFINNSDQILQYLALACGLPFSVIHRGQPTLLHRRTSIADVHIRLTRCLANTIHAKCTGPSMPILATHVLCRTAEERFKGTGWTFTPPSADAMLACMDRALETR